MLLTFDAFGTLFVPRKPVAIQYCEVAGAHGLTGFTDEQIAASFRRGENEPPPPVS